MLDEECDDELWGAAVFGDSLFVSDLSSIYRLSGRTLKQVLDPGEPSPRNHALVATKGALYFLRRDALEVFDGKRWTRISAETLCET